MSKRPMKRIPKRSNPDAFWHKFLNPITMMPDRNRDKRLSSLRKEL